MAPQEIAKDFQSFLAKLQSSSTSPSNPSSTPKGQSAQDSAKGKVDRTTESSAEKEDVWKGKPAPPVDFENFWEAPESLWKPKEWSEREIEAVMVGPFLSLVYASMDSEGCCCCHPILLLKSKKSPVELG
jgi:small subunit ribosomal protein YMR-31